MITAMIHSMQIHNHLVHHLSCLQVSPTADAFPRMVLHLFLKQGYPQMDLLVSDLNHQLSVLCLWLLSLTAWVIDTFFISVVVWWVMRFPQLVNFQGS